MYTFTYSFVNVNLHSPIKALFIVPLVTRFKNYLSNPFSYSIHKLVKILKDYRIYELERLFGNLN